MPRRHALLLAATIVVTLATGSSVADARTTCCFLVASDSYSYYEVDYGGDRADARDGALLVEREWRFRAIVRYRASRGDFEVVRAIAGGNIAEDDSIVEPTQPATDSAPPQGYAPRSCAPALVAERRVAVQGGPKELLRPARGASMALGPHGLVISPGRPLTSLVERCPVPDSHPGTTGTDWTVAAAAPPASFLSGRGRSVYEPRPIETSFRHLDLPDGDMLAHRRTAESTSQIFMRRFPASRLRSEIGRL